jgi:hypothetical protein
MSKGLAEAILCGWVLGTISATGSSVRSDRRSRYAVLLRGRTLGWLPRTLIACHSSNFTCSVSQICAAPAGERPG